LRYEKQALCEAAGAIKQHVVEERVFVGQAKASANDGFVIFLGIPGDADLRSEIFVGLLDAAAETGAELINQAGFTNTCFFLPLESFSTPSLFKADESTVSLGSLTA